MSPALLSLLFEITLALLLVLTISYCYTLNKKIRQLQDGRSELAAMIGRFDSSTERAMHSLAELQNTSKKITDALQLKIDKANFLADDLAFLIEKSSKLATQLEQQKKQGTEALRPPAPPASIASRTPSSPASPSPSLQSPLTKTGIEQLLAASSRPQTPSTASIEAMLNKLAAPAGSPREPLGREETSPRTSAERELLNALKTGR